MKDICSAIKFAVQWNSGRAGLHWQFCPVSGSAGLIRQLADVDVSDFSQEAVCSLMYIMPSAASNTVPASGFLGQPVECIGVDMQVKMVTGDQLLIAKETARQLGMGTNILTTEALLEVGFQHQALLGGSAHELEQGIKLTQQFRW